MTGHPILPESKFPDFSTITIYKRFFISVYESVRGLFEEPPNDLFPELSGEVNGFINTLPSIQNSYSVMGFQGDELKSLMTLKIISAISLWYGFSRKVSPNKRDQVRQRKNSFGNITDRLHSKPNLRINAVIPTKTMNSDRAKMENLFMLAENLSNSKVFFRVYVVGIIPDELKSRIADLNGVHTISLSHDNGPADARNHGIKLSQEDGSDVVIFIDDDVVNPAVADMIEISKRAHETNSIILPKFRSKDYLCYDIYHDLDGTLNGVYINGSENERLLYGTTCVLAVPIEILNRCGFDPYFPIAAGEDIDFSLRATDLGYNILSADDIVFIHDYGYVRGGLKMFVNRFIRYGEGNHLIKEKYPDFYDRLLKSKLRPTLTSRPTEIYIPVSFGNFISKIEGENL